MAERRSETQGARRAKYGLNIAVALLAAIGIVVLLNAAVDYGFRHAAPWAKPWLRLDVTATRQYSLSPQTRKVLQGLDDDYHLVALFRPDSLETQRILDLLEEYPRYSERIAVQQIDPFRDVAANERFLAEVFARYADELEPVRAAIDAGLAALEEVAPAFAGMNTSLQQAVEAQDGQAAAWSQRIQLGVLKQIEQELPRVQERVTQLLDQPLPDYDGLLRTLESALSQLSTRYPQIVTQYRTLVNQDATPAAVKETLLQAIRRLEAMQGPTQQALGQIESASPPSRYTEVMLTLAQTQAVVVLGPDEARVIPAAEMYQQVEGGAAETGPATRGFLGEEKITSALVSLGLDQQPLAVFVSSGDQPVLGPRGAYRFVAQRLESANFEVKQWNPLGQMMGMGQRLPPEPAPEPAAGQPAVWIVASAPPADPRNPASLAGGGRQQIADLLEERLAAGDGVLAMLGPNPAAQFGEPDAVLEVIQAWGITPQLDRVVIQEQTQGRDRVPTWQFMVTTWPEALPITAALGGMRGLFVGPSPVDTSKLAEGVTTWPLVVIEQPRMWVTQKFGNIRSLSELTYEADNAQEQVTVGVAAEREAARLAVVADGTWAIDQLTMAGMGGLPAEMTGLAVPANSELFVNTALWLVDLDQLIAASPRTQDIRRVEAVSPGAMAAYRWTLMAFVPAVILAAGVGVYVVRRRG